MQENVLLSGKRKTKITKKSCLTVFYKRVCLQTYRINWLPPALMLLVLFLITLFSNNGQAQSYAIENVSYTVLPENVIVVNYDLLGANRRYAVDVSLKRKKLPGFSYTPTQVMGDVGKGRFAGRNKKIVWSLDNEDPDNFYIDPYVDDYYLEVTARRSSRNGWFLFPAIIGGVGWLVWQNGDF